MPPSAVYRLPSTRLRRPAFTLVELLMVIVIIGMLVALVSTAAVRAIATGRNAQITTEIGLLDSAMQTYKNDSAGAYPPDCTMIIASSPNGTTPAVAATPANQDKLNRQNRILAHLRKAFPRLIISGGYYDSSGNASAGTLQYMSQNAFKQSTLYGTNGTISQVFASPTPCGAVYGNFDNMDPAEAMVFWMGGFGVPSPPDSTGKILYKLIGFSANKVGNASSAGPNANGPNSGFGPFNLDVQSRDPGPFEFFQARLGDADGDGWPEYYPPNATVAQPPGSTAGVGNPTPPYVYFDSVSYGYYTTAASANSESFYPGSAVYPSTAGAGVQPAILAWGVILPYVQNINPTTNAVTWQNPNKFQIVAGGLDQMYYVDPSGTCVINALRGVSYLSNVTTPPTSVPNGYSQGDLDDLTNFTTSVLQP